MTVLIGGKEGERRVNEKARKQVEEEFNERGHGMEKKSRAITGRKQVEKNEDN